MKYFVLILFPVFAFATPKFDRSVPTDIQNQMIQDLDLVKSWNGGNTSKLYKQIFGGENLEGAVLATFFDQHIKNVDLDDCGGGGAVACVIGVSPTMYLTDYFTKSDIPQALRISILYHEARHTERAHGGWPHATCPVPFLDEKGQDIISNVTGQKLEGLDGCDVVALGSYGLEAIFLKNIENSCATCSAKVLMDAQIYGDDILHRISDASVQKMMAEDLRKP